MVKNISMCSLVDCRYMKGCRVVAIGRRQHHPVDDLFK
ncbi:hypothetical protein D083_3307 [Dickeya solani RNS 08.23.3.1.A]|nr:hypothetical protein D083_3307 [Dickeya solani RNS 08.23.3.1.A]